MANVLLTISKITREATRVLENNMGLTRKINREYKDEFAVAGAKIGNTVNVRKPPRYKGRTGQALAIEDAIETSVPVTLATQRGVDISFTSADQALSIDDFSKRFIKPAINNVANGIDFDATLLYQQIYNTIGTPATVPADLLTYLSCGQRLDEEAAPMDERYICITPAMQTKIVDALKGLFQSSEKIKQQYEKGRMGTGVGFDWSMDQNLRTHKVGPLGGAPLVSGNGQTGNALLTKGWTAAAASRLKAGDVFTIANVNAVNPVNFQSTGSLRQFVVTADFSSAADGTGSVGIQPALALEGPFQTVDALPVDGAAITVLGAANAVTPQGLAFHPDAFTFVSADLELPQGVHQAARVSDKQLGMSIRMVRAYDINTDRFPCRLDILYGFAVIYRELAVRIAS